MIVFGGTKVSSAKSTLATRATVVHYQASNIPMACELSDEYPLLIGDLASRLTASSTQASAGNLVVRNANEGNLVAEKYAIFKFRIRENFEQRNPLGLGAYARHASPLINRHSLSTKHNLKGGTARWFSIRKSQTQIEESH
jgi:hypothetical protein